MPASFKEKAVRMLKEYLKPEGIDLEEVMNAIRYEDGSWNDEDEYCVKDSYQEALVNKEITLGCFVSEKAHNGSA